MLRGCFAREKVLPWSSLGTYLFLFNYIVILSLYEIISDFNKEEDYEFECAIDLCILRSNK